MGMGTNVKYKGKWISMENAIKLRKEDSVGITEEVLEEVLKEETVETLEEVIEPIQEKTEDLVKQYEEVSGKKISPRFRNNKEWLKTNINKYNK